LEKVKLADSEAVRDTNKSQCSTHFESGKAPGQTLQQARTWGKWAGVMDHNSMSNTQQALL